MKEALLLNAIRETDIIIQRACFTRLDTSWGFKTSGAAYTRLYFISSGEGFLKTDNQYIKMLPGNVYLVPAECKFSCGCEYLEKLFFHISVSTVEKYDMPIIDKEILALTYPAENIEKLKALLHSDNYIDILQIKAELLAVLNEFFNKFSLKRTGIKTHSELVTRIINFINENTSLKLKVSDISKFTFLSESKIRNTFLNEMGIPIGKYIDDMIFIKAKRMMAVKEKSIATVSAELGFCDQFYFSRRFKQKFGLSPTEFKKQIR